MAKSASRLNRFFWVLALVAFGIGFYGLYGRIAFGHTRANYGSYVPWGL